MAKCFSLPSHLIITRDSDPRATCGPDGKWSQPLPSCLAPCIIPEVVNGRMDGFNIGAKVEHGWGVAVNCSEDYEVRRV